MESDNNSIRGAKEGGHLKEKPKIVPLLNGPYYLLNDMQPKIVENLQSSEGKQLSTIVGIALCRCGASKNKPFCDGTHGTIGFSSENKTTTTTSTNDNGHTINNGSGEKIIKDKRKSYVGKKITIHDNRRICSHAAECVNNLPSVFKLNARPWIDSDGATVEEIINTIRKCPSGALSYSVDGVEYKDQDERKPMVTVSRDGPFLVTGGIDLIGDNIQFGDGASKERYAPCRSAASSNKPFCDGMHKVINFKDDKN
ncbi:MAG TPA: (4Fe-4S)-binding protein [Nitrososphaeraceae archaeon]|nr:(4Fe-4S)-binding protein [Nitrososphaeraceae archaeon]